MNGGFEGIHMYLSVEEILQQLAQDSSALSQTALEIIRARIGRDPIQKSEMECLDDLHEKLAYVYASIDALAGIEIDYDILEAIQIAREARWEKQLQEAGRKLLGAKDEGGGNAGDETEHTV